MRRPQSNGCQSQTQLPRFRRRNANRGGRTDSSSAGEVMSDRMTRKERKRMSAALKRSVERLTERHLEETGKGSRAMKEMTARELSRVYTSICRTNSAMLTYHERKDASQ